MNVPHEKFCVLPWISIEASPVGTVRPCCLADHEIIDDDGIKCTLGETSFDIIRSTKHMEELRQEFLRGKQPVTCRRCWAEEDAGRISKRQYSLERLKHIILDQTWTKDVKPLMFIDLKLGNICNLKCRICGSWSSSTYAAEEIRFCDEKKNNFHYAMLKLGRWPRENKQFWQEFEDHMADLRYLEFTGGEPFMIQEHFDLLQQLVNQNRASNIEIHYNTNGTIYPSHAEDIWRHFKHVEIAFSIDDVGPRFEYQRSGADWVAVNDNIARFKTMRQRARNMTLQACITVNAFNVMYLHDVANWIDQQGFDFVYWNMLHDAPQFCIANLPAKVKDLVEQKLLGGEFQPGHAVQIQGIVDFMRRGQKDLGKELRDSIRLVDRRRSQNLTLVAPELAQVLDYEA